MKTLSLRHLLAALILGAVCAGVQATPVLFSYNGSITTADAGNPFHLSAGDTVNVSGTYDSSFYNGSGLATIPFFFGTGNSFTLNLGIVTLTEANDIDYLLGVCPTSISGFCPTITLDDGLLVSLDFATHVSDNVWSVEFISSDFINGYEFDAAGAPVGFITGTWFPTPEPGTLALFGVAAFALAGACRRR